jgi:hypothetical protein
LSTLFDVTEKKEDLPVFKITNVDNPKDQRTVHRNLLMECNDLPRDAFANLSLGKVKKVNNTKKRSETKVEQVDEESDGVMVFLHEDVADVSLGGGNGDGINVVETQDVDGDGELVADGDAELEADAEPEPDVSDAESDVTDDPDDPDPEPQPIRKSVRLPRVPKVFTYNEIGGPPLLIDLDVRR